MKPTPFEIAMLARIVAGGKSPEQWQIHEAMTEWFLARDAIDALFARHAKASAEKEQRDGENLIPLDTRLEQMTPDITDRAYRRKRFFEYIKARAREFMSKSAIGKRSPTDDEIEKAAGIKYEEHRKNGVPPLSFEDFPSWVKQQTSGKRAEAGRKGAEVKKAKADAARKRKMRQSSKVKITYLGTTPANEGILDAL